MHHEAPLFGFGDGAGVFGVDGVFAQIRRLKRVLAAAVEND